MAETKPDIPEQYTRTQPKGLLNKRFERVVAGDEHDDVPDIGWDDAPEPPAPGAENDAVGKVDRDTRVDNQNLRAGLKFGGSRTGARSDLARLAAAKMGVTLDGEEDDEDMILKAAGVQAYLEKLQERIDALIADIAQLKRDKEKAQLESDAAWKTVHDAEDLRGDIKDGISPEERDQLVQLFGDKAKNASIEGLNAWLALLIAEQTRIARAADGDVSKLDDDIDAAREKLADAQKQQDQALVKENLHEQGLISDADYINSFENDKNFQDYINEVNVVSTPAQEVDLSF